MVNFKMNESKLNTINIVGTRYNCYFIPISRYVIFNFMYKQSTGCY